MICSEIEAIDNTVLGDDDDTSYGWTQPSVCRSYHRV